MEVTTLINLLVLQGYLFSSSFTTAQTHEPLALDNNNNNNNNSNNNNNNNISSGNCTIDVATGDQSPSFFNKLDGSYEAMLQIIRTVKITAPSNETTHCTFDVSELLEAVPEDEVFVLYTGLVCPEDSNFQLVLENPSGKQNKDAIGYLVSSRCNLYWKHAAVYGHSVDLRVLYFQHVKDQYEEEKALFGAVPDVSKPYDAGLENIGTFGFFTNLPSSKFPSILSEFTWQKVAEISVVGYSFSYVPEELLMVTMPQLQTLELTACGLTGPPSFFPWDNEAFVLPRNLSRSPVSNDHYSKTFGIEVEPNYYRRFLDLKQNAITDLKDFQFTGFIQQISLKGNGLEQLGEDTFRFIQGLQNLDLSGNQLEKLPANVFRGQKDILHLNIEHNMISSFDAETFLDLPSLQTLSLSHNKLSTIGAGSFSQLPSLQSLRVASNSLTLIEEDVVMAHTDQLQAVDFSRNKLSSIPKWLFLMRKLVNIDISDNQITFDSLHRLVSSVDPTLLTYQNRQTASSYSGNIIQAATKKFVSLQRNNITTMPTHGLSQKDNITFSNLLFFFRFDVTGNPIKCDCNTFPFYQYLLPDSQSKEVNRLPQDNIDSWKCDSPNSVKGTPIVDVPATTFQCSQNFSDCPARCTCYQRSVDQVVEVDCRKQKLTQMPEKVPKGTEVLYLDRNGISKIKTSYPYFSTLRSLTLAYNNVSKISDSVVESFTNLSHLELHNNRLQYLPEVLTNLDLKTISVRNNPLVCDCRSKWVKYWLLSERHAITDFEDILCTSGKAQGKHFVEARDDEFVCEISTEGKAAIGLAVFIVVVTVVVCVTYRFRGEIKLFLYVHFNWHPFDKSDDEDCDKLFDAFVSYSGIDYRWVCHILRKKVELRDPPYRLCLHDRDFMPGYPIQENIKNAIDNSRRMIVILSKNYIQSDWCLYEFRAAHHKVMNERCNFLIVIKCSDVSMNDLDEDLQLYLRTNTYLDVSNKWFWEKLFYTLPQNPLSILKRSNRQEPENPSTSPLFVPASLPPVRIQQQPVPAGCNGTLLSDTLGEQQPFLSQARCPSGQPSVVLVPPQQTGDGTSAPTAYIPYQMDLCTPWPAKNYLQAADGATLCQANGYIPFPGGSFLPDENPPVGYQDSDSESEDGENDNDEVHINVDGTGERREIVRVPAVNINVEEETTLLPIVMSSTTPSPTGDSGVSIRDPKSPDSATPLLPKSVDVTGV